MFDEEERPEVRTAENTELLLTAITATNRYLQVIAVSVWSLVAVVGYQVFHS